MKSIKIKSAVAIAAACIAGAAMGAGEQDAARLGKDLTPAGAEPGANKDGSIPAWSGTAAPMPGWEYGKKRVDYWKHKGDKPLFSIDASNVDKYADKLAAGQVAVIKQIKGYRMDVYASHRECGMPDFVVENTKKNVAKAKLAADGWGLADAVVPGLPFPIPANGTQAMWNAKMRYRGVGILFPHINTAVSPRKGSTDWIIAGQELTFYYPWGVKGSNDLGKYPPVEYYVLFQYDSPPALAGQALSVTFFLDKPGSETFYYFPGQRRVRRMPTYSYDSPQIGLENQYTLDEPMVFNGTIDRFDWKIVGKKEMYVGYNAFGAYDFTAKFQDVAHDDAIVASARRYELHRVWVIEATVKAGMRHTAPKRTFYLDEDSWGVMAADDYDAQGKLFKYREGYLIPSYETGTCDVTSFAQYNLAEGRYLFDMNPVGGGKDMRWVVEAGGPRFNPSYFSAENVRAISER
ncbi:MAG: DUF1329 domain-containing protein [Proteobacteria bacterium]|jgi:hypothetical protein|nr:DUF1329 domain-containing protein [Pseudomonadota bacterium]